MQCRALKYHNQYNPNSLDVLKNLLNVRPTPKNYYEHNSYFLTLQTFLIAEAQKSPMISIGIFPKWTKIMVLHQMRGEFQFN